MENAAYMNTPVWAITKIYVELLIDMMVRTKCPKMCTVCPKMCTKCPKTCTVCLKICTKSQNMYKVFQNV